MVPSIEMFNCLWDRFNNTIDNTPSLIIKKVDISGRIIYMQFVQFSNILKVIDC